ncbi:MAG TPA: Ig-like domain-containing protein [Candidatus Sumerlaeota bacterium]|nr:Ig-like domain-containing protein [Candidatus Sumerlaeota bacterium]
MTATSAGNGSVSKSPDQPTYNHGTVVTLTATPVPGYHFTGWTGTVNSSANPLDVTMDSTKTLTANFAINTYGLTVNATNGSVSKSPNQTAYDHGTFVTLTATPAVGYHFTGWTGDVTSTTNPLSVAMDSTKTLTANFSINTYNLTATSAGHGSVSKSPDQPTYNHGTVVTLTATPETGYHFSGWTGDVTSTVNPLDVTMDSTKTVTANFAINTYALTISAANGSVTRSPDLAVYNHGTTVTLTAKPATGYRFSGWTGAVTSTQNPLVVTVDAAKSLTANFILQGYELNVGAVNGSVSKSPDQAAYVHGTVVALTATPETGYHFSGWTGDTTSTVNPLSITMDSTKTLTAHFTINTYAVNVQASAHGTAAKSPDLAVYPYGSTITLMATPAVGYHFTGWSGTTNSTRNPLVLTVDSTQTLTAGFAINSYPLSVIAEQGTVSKSPDQAVYEHGSAVILTATPDAFYQFVGWSGSATGTTNPLTLTMDSTKTLTARFETIEYDLAAQAVDGRVAVSPFGARQLRGTTVTLFALPNPGYSFLGWVGDVPFGQESDNPLKFSILADTSVTAVFEPVSGPVLAWGSNSLGQRDVPQPNSGYASVASGSYHSLAVKADGSVAAWGQNESGQCDLPTTNTGFVAVAAGFRHSLGLKADGSVVGWGENYSGECTAPEPNTSFTAVSAGFRYSMGLKRDGSVVVWGSDNNAALKTVPEPNADFVAISAGYMHCLALKADGTIVAWGNNDSRQTQVPAPNADFVAVAAGMWFSLGLKADGSIVAWGQNDQGQCRVPAPNTGFVGLAAGSKHGLGLKSNGSLVAWGDNRQGQCVISEPNIGCVAISAGAEHSLAIKTGGLLKVTLTPAEAVAAGAQWRLSDEKVGVWHNSGASVSLLAGTFTLEFKDVVGWDTPTTRSVVIRPNEFTEASATYGRHVWALTTSSTLHGSIQVSSEGTTFTHGTSVTLTAKPDEGYLFAGWQGDVPAGQEKVNPLTLVMDSDKTVKAIFELYVIRYPLSVTVAGTGSGSVQKTPDQTLYDAGTTVTLTATPAAGSSFSGWLGDVPTGREMENPLVMVMDSTRTLTATFSLGGGGNQYPLLIATAGTGSGTVQRVPEQVVYAEGTTVTLTPLPALDSAFTGWTGDVPAGQENANPLVVTMDATRTLTAVFTRDAVAPSVAVSSPVDDPTSATVFPVTVTFSEPVTGFTAEDLVTSNAVVSNFAAAQGASVYTFDLMVTATRFCQVTVDVPAGAAFDVANNPNTAAPQFVRSYEVAGAVAPTVLLTSNAVSPTRSRAIPVTIAFDQDVTGFAAGDLALGNATVQNFLALDAKTYTVELVSVADGEVTVTVPADVALSPVGMGNRASTTTLTFLYDGTAPTAFLSTVMDDPTSVSRALVKVTFSEPVTTLTLAGIEITGGTARNLVQLDTLVYGFVVDTQVDGDVTIRIKPGVVLDGVGNANTASAPLTWTFDTLAPQVTLSAVEKTSETRIPVTVTFSEPVKGFEVSDLVTSGGVAQNLVEASETGLSYTFDFVVTTTRSATLLAVLPGGSCADWAGNPNALSLPLAIFYEPKPPVQLPLDAPTSVTASDGDFNYKIAVAWNAVPEATHYQIYRSTSLDGTRIIIGSWQTATTFNDGSVEPETEYYYWVRAAADVTGSRASDPSEPDSGWMSSSEVVPTADYKIVYRRCTFEENTLTTGSLVFKTSSPASWVKIIRLPKGKPAKAVDRPGRIAYRTLPALPILRIEGDMRSLYSMVEIERLETSGTLRSLTGKGANVALVSAGSLGAVRITAYRNSSPASAGTAAEFASTSIYSTQPGSPASVLLAGSILADLKSAQSFRFVKSSTKLYQVKMATGRERRISLGGIGSVAQVVEDAYGVVSSEPIASNSALEAPEIGLVQVTGGPVVCDRITADVQQVRALSAQYRIPASKSQPVVLQGNVRVSEIVSGVTIRKIEARATRASGTWVGGAIGHLDDFNLLRVVAPDLGMIWGDLGVSGRFIAGTDDAGQPDCQGKIDKFGTKRGVGAFRGQAYCVKMPLFSPEKGLDFEVFLTPPVQ